MDILAESGGPVFVKQSLFNKIYQRGTPTLHSAKFTNETQGNVLSEGPYSELTLTGKR